jgi:hypothetical protein
MEFPAVPKVRVLYYSTYGRSELVAQRGEEAVRLIRFNLSI